jgi:hypothetical protein
MPNDKLSTAKSVLASANAFQASINGPTGYEPQHSSPEVRGAGHDLGAGWATSHGNDHTGTTEASSAASGIGNRIQQMKENQDILNPSGQ